MDALFSCRNCIHNGSQTLLIGPGEGYCLKHDSLIADSTDTTCKYLHRKDLPMFVVDEGIREHAAEFAEFPGLARLSEPAPINRIRYREKERWESGNFDPIIHALAEPGLPPRSWQSIQPFSSGIDGRRSLSYSCLVRRFLETCDTWLSAYRLILAFIQEIDAEPAFLETDLLLPVDPPNTDEAGLAAIWDVVFCRLATLQEYGWHAGLADLTWVTDTLVEPLIDLDWPALKSDLSGLKGVWTSRIIKQAKENQAFFPAPIADAG